MAKKIERICKMCNKMLKSSQDKYCSRICYNLDPDSKNLKSENTKKQWDDEGKSKAMLEGQKKGWLKSESHENARNAQIKYNKDYPEAKKEKGRKLHQMYIDFPEKRDEVSKSSTGRKHSVEAREKRRIDQENKMSNPEFVRKVFKRREMSSSEIAFQKIIDGNGFPFYFNGTLSKEGRRVLIGRKIPDFVHNTEKKIIEIYGDKPHANPKIFKKEYITPHGRVAKDVWELDEKRVSFIKSQGYQVLIIWASELKKHFEIEEMVKRFVNND